MPHATSPRTHAAPPRAAWKAEAFGRPRGAPETPRPSRTEPWRGVRDNLPAHVLARLAPGALDVDWGTDELVLSARTPAIAGKGSIHSWSVQSRDLETPALYFDHEGERAEGGMMIWLEALDPDGLYVVELRLSVLEGVLEVGNSDGPCMYSAAQGLDHRVHVVLDRPSLGAALFTLRPVAVRDWAFYEARLRRLS